MAVGSSWLTFILPGTPSLGEVFFSEEFRERSQNRSSLALVSYVSLPTRTTMAGGFGDLIGGAWSHDLSEPWPGGVSSR